MNRDSIQPPGRADLPRRGHLPHYSHLPQCNRPPHDRRERLLVLGPLGIALSATVAGAEQAFLATLWLSALAWTVLASLALALLAGLRRGDWSAFRDHEHREDRDEEMDLDLRVGAYAFLREREKQVLADGRLLADSSLPADGNDPLH